MPKTQDDRLNETELQAVETTTRRNRRPEVRQRCTAIRLLHLGPKAAQKIVRDKSLAQGREAPQGL